jgi:two-component system cell cycle response regulator
MAPKTILVIEDNELNLKLVIGLLTIGNFNSLSAPDAETGIHLARMHRPDLILMDIQLPGLDGLSATRMIKSDEKLKHIPVVALTSYAMQGDDQKAQAAGCDGYVTKPIDTRTFNKIVESFFEAASYDKETLEESIQSRPLILIVDDEPKNIKLLRAKLSKTPYQIEQAVSGFEAIEKAQTLLPDLILLDVMMPEIDGYEVARRLKTDPKLNLTPIIMVTSLDSADAKAKGMNAGAEEFMTKPIHTEELMARINSMIQLKPCEQ